MSHKKAITLYLHVHQPFRVRQYSVFDTGDTHDYFGESDPRSNQNNQRIFERVADKSYRPMNALLLRLLGQHDDFKLSLSITGTFLEQAEQWAPDVITSFQALVATGKVEILAETYHHSLAFFYSRNEFEDQVAKHQEKIQSLFGVTPKVFRNTELAYNNELASWAESKGYSGILAEGWDQVLQWRSPNYLYRPAGTENIGLLLKNYRLSDDLAFRFSDQSWGEWPLTADRYTDWLRQATDRAPLVNLFMDYETFGEHQWSETGIFTFFEQTVSTWLEDEDNTFYTVSDAIASSEPIDEIDMPHTVTWADTERDLSAWNGNKLQQEALRYLYRLERDVLRTDDAQLIQDWRRLQASDLVYYMCTKNLDDGAVHAYFSPYDSPYDAFLFFMNVIRDLRWRLIRDHKTGGLHG